MTKGVARRLPFSEGVPIVAAIGAHSPAGPENQRRFGPVSAIKQSYGWDIPRALAEVYTI